MKKQIFNIISGIIVGICTGIVLEKGKQKITIQKKDKKIEKFKRYYNLLNQWMTLKISGRNLADVFLAKGYKKIGIYGMGELGNRLYEELENTSVEVTYVADESPQETYSNIDVIEIEDMTDDVDVIVVTAIFAMDSIEENLSKRLNCEIISLEDIIYEL